MILDKETYMAKDKAVTSAAVVGGTVVNLVKGGQHYMLHGFVPVRVTTAFSGGTSLTFELVVADNDALSTNPVVVASSGAILTAALTANTTVFTFKLPDNLGDATKKYFGIKATPVGTFSAGKFDAYITMDVPKSYAVS